MKFSINSKILQSKLAAAFKAVPQRSSLQILNNFLIRAADDFVTVSASDTENAISVAAPADVSAPGSACVDAKFLMGLIKKTANVPVTFERKENSVIISTESARYRTASIDASCWPSEDGADECVAEISVNAKALLKSLQRVSFAVGSDTLRPAMTGVCVDCSESGMRLYATDTRRMARYIIGGTYPQCRFTLPLKAVQMLSSLGEGEVSVKVEPRSVLFSADGFIMRSQLFAEKYPDCERVIPRESSIYADIDRQALAGAIRRASLCSSDAVSPVKLVFSDKSVEVFTQDAMLEREGHESVPCSCPSPITIGFSADYIQSVLSAADGDDLRIGMTESFRPAVFRSADDTDGTFTLVCMPISLV